MQVQASLPGPPAKATPWPSSAPVTEKPQAYVTLLMGTSDWWKGVVGLANSLRAVNSKHCLVVLVGREVPPAQRRILQSHGCQVREIEPIVPPKGFQEAHFAVAHYTMMYTKLRIWELDEFARLIYLDADTLVVQNLDHLFWEVPRGKVGGVLDCFCEGEAHPEWHRRGGYCQVAPQENPWSSPSPPPPAYINAGMLVLDPSREVFEEMMRSLASYPPTPLAEQDFLNSFFEKDIVALPPAYNLQFPLLWHHPQQANLETAKLLHYSVTGAKPWRFDPEAKNMDLPVVHRLVDKWKQVFGQETLAS